ncbi:alpha-hydroxy-acid oxidizing protein [Sphingomonas aracearum]|uniref:Alpha-hydroxy-acid oxidizing protein n=1 Tax=Sphingomonas aracearum TaxID=2283317 RepID=A0A369VWA6_9SPHN|nr:alpha-hydroxy-acid oxidizing protein [Sphingomonas aracearum]
MTSAGEAPLPPLATIPPDLRSLADYEQRARAHLPAATWAHVEDRAGRGITLDDNRAAFDRVRLLPRALASLAGGSTASTLLGVHHPCPVLLGPVAYQRLAHAEGELATIRAATALGTGSVLSTLSSVPLEQVAAARLQAADQLDVAPAPLWFQLYLQPRREDSATLLRRAEAAGYQAIVLTIDAGVKRSGFVLPPGVEAANLAGMEAPRHVASAGGRLLFGTALTDAVPTWEDLAWLRAATDLPVLVKGMLVGDDLERALAAGADGLILSNHGGRVLDGLPATLDLLPQVAAAVAGRVPVLLDGGVRTGTDVVKALCLGAIAVLVARPVLHALAVAGLAGVAHLCHLLRAELELAMAQLGCATLDDLTEERLFTTLR